MDYKQGIDLSTYYSSDGFRNQTPQTETYPNWPHLNLFWILVKGDQTTRREKFTSLLRIMPSQRPICNAGDDLAKAIARTARRHNQGGS